MKHRGKGGFETAFPFVMALEMRGTKLNLNPVQKTNEKFQNAIPNQKVGRKADYAKSISLVPELRV